MKPLQPAFENASMSKEIVTAKAPFPVPLAIVLSLREPLNCNEASSLLAGFPVKADGAALKLTLLLLATTVIGEIPALPSTCVPTAVAEPSPARPNSPRTFCATSTVQSSTAVAVTLKPSV